MGAVCTVGRRCLARSLVLFAAVALGAVALAPVASAETNGAMAWGLDRWGELGIGTTEVESEFGGLPFNLSFYPLAVNSLSGVSSISAGDEQTLDLLEDGSVQAFGANEQGQLGIGTNSGPEMCLQGRAAEENPAQERVPCSTLPVEVPGLTDVRQVASGGEHSLALLENGTVMAWGSNEAGQLGSPSAGPEICERPGWTDPVHGCSRVPVAVAGLSGVKAIAAGAAQSFALLENGTVAAWGNDEFGYLGVAGEFAWGCGERGLIRCQPTPTLVRTSGGQVLHGVTAIAAGASHALALLEDGTVVGWGTDNTGEVGDGQQEDKYSAVPVTGLSGVTALGAGSDTSAALLSDGTVDTWGDNMTGQLGVGTDTGPELCSVNAPEIACSTTPVPVPGVSGVKEIGIGSEDDIALLEDGAVLAWGNNNAGGLGTEPLGPELCRVGPDDSGERCSTVPVSVGGLDDVTAIAVSSGDNDSFAYGPLVPSVSGVEGEEEGGANAQATGATRRDAGKAAARRAKGSELGGTTVRIAGSDLSGATAVLFGGRAAASFTVDKLSEVTAVSPPGKGTVDVTVITPRGQSPISAGDHFTYGPAGPPAVSGVSPAEGFQAGGTSVTITGTNLNGATAVSFGGTPAESFTVNVTGTITAVAPAGSGTVDVTVLTPLGESATNTGDRYRYLPPALPTVTKLSPKKGSTAGGTHVTIIGTNFIGVQAIYFAGTEATSFTVQSSGAITAIAPAGTSGSADVVVATGIGRSAITDKDLFKYGGPTITAISPSSGTAAGGEEVMISGSGFAPAAATTFTFGKQAATAVNCSSSSACTALTPAAAKPGTVKVVAAVGKSRSATSFAARYTYR